MKLVHFVSLCLILALACIAAPASAQEVELTAEEWQEILERLDGEAIAAAPNVYCQGKFSCPGCGTECIRVVVCDPPGSDCECGPGGVTCGDNHKDAPDGKDFVEGSCKITILSTRGDVTPVNLSGDPQVTFQP